MQRQQKKPDSQQIRVYLASAARSRCIKRIVLHGFYWLRRLKRIGDSEQQVLR